MLRKGRGPTSSPRIRRWPHGSRPSKRWRSNRDAGVSSGDQPRASVDVAVPIVGASARVDVELLADAIDLPPPVSILDLRQRVNAGAFEEYVRDEEAAEVRGVRDAAAGVRDR